MENQVTTTIDLKKCTGCGACQAVCPSETIEVEDKKARVKGERCLACDHCGAVCPEGAVRVGAVDENALKLQTIDKLESWCKFGDFDTGALVNLMESRRSCRSYKEKTVPSEILEDLVKIGTTAPSGTNCQYWKFTVLANRDPCLRLVNGTMKFYERLNSLAKKKSVRAFSRLLTKDDQIGWYFREYYDKVQLAIDEWKTGQVDRLLHGATATIIVSSAKGATCPQEDALLATQNILLAAHAMGLGTCLIGFAVTAMARDQAIKGMFGIPKEEKVYSVIALGYPGKRESYKRPAGRKPLSIRLLS